MKLRKISENVIVANPGRVKGILSRMFGRKKKKKKKRKSLDASPPDADPAS